jgi:hypothetical protein
MGANDLSTFSGTPVYATGSAKFGADGLATGCVLRGGDAGLLQLARQLASEALHAARPTI